MRKTISGFTIVELLIVIVVIGILAAITIVAYNGVQQRAQFALDASNIDKIGKAIRLYETDIGTTMGYSGVGYNGKGLGGFCSTGGSYGDTSVYDALVAAGYLPQSFQCKSTYMVTPCTTYDDPRWVVLATFSPPPPTPLDQQISDSGCTSGWINSYTDPSGNYKRNYVKAF